MSRYVSAMTRALHMRWENLVFLHWPARADEIRPLLPPRLELDTFEGTPWVGVVPFRMTNVRAVLAPPIPTAHDFPELNVRTYVTHGGHAGVWFFSLDAESWLAVMAARAATNLPYYYARMKAERTAEQVDYESERGHPGSPTAEFRARYRPIGTVFASKPGTFEHWSTQRLSLFTATRDGNIERIDVEHDQWPLQPATAEIERNTMATAAGISLPEHPPRAHFAESLDVVAHWPVAADSARAA
jgi:uncharacterized protein YqjF (DUF2071 family)